MSAPAGRLTEVLEPALAGWLTDRIGQPGPWELRRLAGGNSNETCLLTSGTAEYILRRPPRHALSASAHSVAREHRLLTALAGTGVPAPGPVALCEDPAVPLAPFLVMEHVAGAVSITDELPPGYRDDPSAREPRLRAVIDWEMATICDPLLDLGLLLALWGERPLAHPAMPGLQAVSRATGAPDRDRLLARYEGAVGHQVHHLRYYRCLALFKLAAIVEAAWSQYLAGELRTDYAAALGRDVPALLAEACATAGLPA